MKQSANEAVTANVSCPRDATHVFSKTDWGVVCPKTFSEKKYRQPVCWTQNTTKSVSCNSTDGNDHSYYCLQGGQLPTYLVRSIAFTNKCWLPFKALRFLVGDAILCCHPTHISLQTPELLKGSLCCGSAFCTQMFVKSPVWLNPQWDALGDTLS